jgi:nitrate reductase beta subunit
MTKRTNLKLLYYFDVKDKTVGTKLIEINEIVKVKYQRLIGGSRNKVGFFTYLPLLAVECKVPCCVKLSPSTGSYKTAGDGTKTYAAVSPVAIIMATNIVANIALFIIPSISWG